MSDKIWEVLITVAAARAIPDGRERVTPLLAGPGFDFEALFGRAARHHLLAALADFLQVQGLRDAVPPRLLSQADILRNAGQHRAATLTEEAARLGEVLRKAGVSGAWTKGVVAHHTLYEHSGARLFNDIDIMIHPQHRKTADEALTASGYSRNSRYDAATRTLAPLPKAELRVYQLSPDHLPHYHRLGPDPVVSYIAVDVANSFTWHTSSWQVPMEEALTELRRVDTGSGQQLHTLTPTYAFLFTCLHLFREGWLTRVASVKPLTLAQFGDVVTEWHRLRPAERTEVHHMIKRLNLTQPMAWVVAHTDSLFGSDISAELDLTSEATQEWLATSMLPDGPSEVSPATMEHRLRRPLGPYTTAGLDVRAD
ncbi:nucleotidyltransferase family protein [Streptomyces zingiberis]|uniref:Nucleotidyltransferase family protein n=1 Tax=Streptomyces zingiberis TaxID=2053010 RepID=A0ABX1BXE0_9ACTN|nr:nucleotidyltransferase family protein [Streptomyces zingiberis]NJQ01093.1 nucleotidyltransferase family protein [Streptomyces zingiberis]